MFKLLTWNLFTYMQKNSFMGLRRISTFVKNLLWVMDLSISAIINFLCKLSGRRATTCAVASATIDAFCDTSSEVLVPGLLYQKAGGLVSFQSNGWHH